MVAEDGRLALGDFGTAKEFDAQGFMAINEPLVGNQQHMAPEVLNAIYALKVLDEFQRRGVRLGVQNGKFVHADLLRAFTSSDLPIPRPGHALLNVLSSLQVIRPEGTLCATTTPPPRPPPTCGHRPLFQVGGSA